MAEPQPDPAPSVVVDVCGRLSPDEVHAVTALVDDATDADGVHPLSEHVTLHLTHGGDIAARNLLVRVDGELAAYAHLDVTDVVEGASAELVVGPAFRRRGIATAAVRRLVDLAPDHRLRLWAHGSHPAADALATKLGFRRTRALWQMRRSLYAPLPAVELPDGIAVRSFVPGQDEQRWIEVNNRAFADHPDQGRWTIDDLLLREREPWFDPHGFFLAERAGELVGFHWTKVHGAQHHDGREHDHHHDPIGEVYIVGVDPSAQGQGLGPQLTTLGLRYLRARGLPQVMLYVDEANTNAITVYERLGFTRWNTDVLYRTP